MKTEHLTAVRFKPYGYCIEYPGKNRAARSKNLFRIVVRESGPTGWRIAYLVVRDTRISRLEQHPGSYESFEPVKGQSLLFVSRTRDERDICCFYLDTPVVLFKNIWHGIVTIGAESEVKITENSRVKCVYLPLSKTLPER